MSSKLFTWRFFIFLTTFTGLYINIRSNPLEWFWWWILWMHTLLCKYHQHRLHSVDGKESVLCEWEENWIHYYALTLSRSRVNDNLINIQFPYTQPISALRRNSSNCQHHCTWVFFFVHSDSCSDNCLSVPLSINFKIALQMSFSYSLIRLH